MLNTVSPDQVSKIKLDLISTKNGIQEQKDEDVAEIMQIIKNYLNPQSSFQVVKNI